MRDVHIFYPNFTFSYRMFYKAGMERMVAKNPSKFGVNWESLPNKNIPVLLHSIFESSTKIGENIFNSDEVNIVRFYVDLLLAHGVNGQKILQNDILIVTPLPSQEGKFREEFMEEPEIAIGNGRSCRQLQKKIIFLSPVLSGPKFAIANLEDEKVSLMIFSLDVSHFPLNFSINYLKYKEVILYSSLPVLSEKVELSVDRGMQSNKLTKRLRMEGIHKVLC